MDSRTLAWWRMAFRVLAAARVWHREKCHVRSWNASPADRELFAAVSDVWADIFMQDRPVNSRVLHDRRRACPSRDRLVAHDA